MTDENDKVKTAVDLAVLSTKLDNVIEGIGDLKEITEKQVTINTNHETRIGVLEDRQTRQSRVQALLTGAGVVIAGWWGARS